MRFALAPAGLKLVSADGEEICRVVPLPGFNLDTAVEVTGDCALLPDPRLVLACGLVPLLGNASSG
jgi:hypothetical protein